MKLRLRHDLLFTPQPQRGRAGYRIEDPLTGRFYRVGLPEYRFISLLDGCRSVAQALEQANRVPGGHPFSRQQAAAICKWLLENELATVTGPPPTRLPPRPEAQHLNLPGWLNPLVIKLPLCHPDRVLARLLPWLGWLHSPPFLVLWLAACLSAGYQVVVNWPRFVACSEGMLAPPNWLWLAAAWLALKLVHELSHGLACKKYGGNVREAGVLLILFAPRAYVDVTSSWRFGSKWQRIQTAAAGMYAELFVAALAAWTWAKTSPGTVHQLAFNVVVMASVTTLLFNANPLMRFDGYYILADLLGIPNLYTSGRQYLNYVSRRYLLGLPAELPSWPFGQGLVIRVYAIASLFWRALICAGLLIVATTLFYGAGLVLAVAAGLLWCGLPLAMMVKGLLNGRGPRPNWVRMTSALTAGGGLAATLLMGTAVPTLYRAPAIVQFAPLTVVRAESPGFVAEVKVKGGQHVQPDQVLILLENRQLAQELADLDLEIEQVMLRSRVYAQQREMAAWQIEQKNLEALRKRRHERQQQVDRLTVRAPVGGRVITSNLETLLGTYISSGTALLSIGRERHKELVGSVSETAVGAFQSKIGSPVKVRAPGLLPLRGLVTKVSPRASVEPPAPGFCAPWGGPLPVRTRRQGQLPADSSAAYQLLQPRFTATVALSPQSSGILHAGQLVTLCLWSDHQSPARRLYCCAARWVRRRLRRANHN